MTASSYGAGGGAMQDEMQQWVAAMRAGDFDRAWTISDRSLARASATEKYDGPRHLQRIWRGESLQGRTVMVRCYHGLGDTIQFIRFARPLREIARQVIVWCQPELLELISDVDGVDCAVPLRDVEPDISFDVDIEIMEIPHALRATRDQIVPGAAYLQSPALSRPANMHAAGETLSIGVVWRSGDWDPRRSFPVLELAKLSLPGTQLFSLQLGAAAEASSIGAIDISVTDLTSLASRLCALDLVICPDGMVAHLAAAHGCRTWIVLPADCDWRWPDRGRRTPWYPTARLFHQRRAGDWQVVFNEVRAALASLLRRRRLLKARLELAPPARYRAGSPAAKLQAKAAEGAGNSG